MPSYSLSLGDAESYLKPLGVHGPPESWNGELECLSVGYNDGKEGKESRSKYLNGSCFQFMVDDDRFLQNKPRVTFANKGSSTLVFLDPDAPDRVAEDMPGGNGPYLHWLVTDATGDEPSTGKELCPYQGPAPPQGKHRYIFIEFEQSGPVTVGSVERKAWDFKGFLAVNKKVLTPKAINFYYCSKDIKAAAGPPNPPHRTGNATDLPWYPQYGEPAKV